MQLAEAYANKSVDEIKAALAGATLRIYSCPQPENADKPIIRNGLLGECVLSGIEGDQANVAEAFVAKNVGTPLFSRATTPDGAVIGDFSTGPGDSDIKLAEVSCSKGAPIKITLFQVRPGVANGVMPVNPRDKMVDKFGITQLSHENTYAWNADFASRKTK
ncbi:hypothetical protein [Beijerinckia indica]|uniref:Uncharacterized protein n=1 Tax=Beijerinckia indica subsp. indica (strain ATCC 9039 / DSM 1715 / NCIMB 8712) TaxID=395963 RepID=B2IH58_BEII9|nr:hypothetical protein [Beijerinckia indica]ACB94472.1 conserved hypothetical protein [Beijerinckia indica subsp. indica ATCC 9039]